MNVVPNVPNVPNAPNMVSYTMDTMEEYNKNFLKKVSEAAVFQLTGGFEIPSDVTPDNLERLNTTEILKRLLTTSNGNNVIAVSEFGNGIKAEYTTDLNNTKDPNNPNETLAKRIPGLDGNTFILDTCFVLGNEVPNVNTVPNVITVDGISIASVHFSGDGPNSMVSHQVGDDFISQVGDDFISEFIKRELESVGINSNANINIVCGDTNITRSKINKFAILSHTDIGPKIALGLSKHLGGNWLVIMSNCKVDKVRTGFVVLNQQLKKSTKTKSPEEDGTIIAIKYNEDLPTLIDLPNHYKCYNSEGLINNDNENNNNATENNNNADIMKFTENILDDNTKLYIDNIFLDHSVVQISSGMLTEILNKTILWNLISINMGSIVNSKHKNWNTRYIKNYKLIQQADEAIYQLLKEYNQTPLPDQTSPPDLPLYDNIEGSTLVNQTVRYDQNFISEKKIINELTNVIEQTNMTVQGGRTRKHKRKYKNKTRKYKNKARKYKKL